MALGSWLLARPPLLLVFWPDILVLCVFRAVVLSQVRHLSLSESKILRKPAPAAYVDAVEYRVGILLCINTIRRLAPEVPTHLGQLHINLCRSFQIGM